MTTVYSIILKPEIKTMTLYDENEIEIGEYQYKEFDLYDIDGYYITTDTCPHTIEDESEVISRVGIMLGFTQYASLN